MSTEKQQMMTIGPIGSRRVAFWEAALQGKKYTHSFLSYKEVLANDFPKISKPTTLRITSPGESFDLKKELMFLGGYPTNSTLVFDKGRIDPNPYWYKGWYKVLERIAEFISQNPLVKTMNTPTAIQLAFHKLKCQKRLASLGIRTPKLILEELTDFDHFIETLQAEKENQVFIKPYHGSSASGVMAFRQAQGKQLLYTTIKQTSKGLYNNLRLQKYTSPHQIKSIIEAMIPSGLLVERWVPKKTFQNKSVDFRILVINGKAAFVVPRMSHHCITNLHLGNEKGKIQEVVELWGEEMIENAKMLAVSAVNTLGGLFYAGLDVAITRNGKPYVLEVNAFGDMLLNIYQDGLNAYEYELKEWEEQMPTSKQSFRNR